MNVLLVVAAVLIGLTIGVFGSGGSILTVPVLRYVLGHEDKAAVAESLAIVGLIAVVGFLPYAHKRLVHWRSVLFFGVPGMIGTYGGAWLAKFVPGPVQLVLFAGVMLLAAAVLWVRGETKTTPGEIITPKVRPKWIVIVEGLIVGVLTGLVGVGGGFIIVPALVVLGGLDLRRAVGTSLVIIALKSAAGFLKYVSVLEELNIDLNGRAIAILAVLGIVGSLAGRSVSSRLPVQALQRAFVIFLVIMAGYVLSQEIPRLTQPVSEPPTQTIAPSERPTG